MFKPPRLAPNALRLCAADSFRRARIARQCAIRFPWTAERELRSAAYWVGSASYWRAQAELEAFIPSAE